MRLPPRLADQDGFSLPELLITIVIVGITFVAILTGLITTIRVSAVHRTEATTDSVVRSAAEWVKDNAHNPYAKCAGTGTYSFNGLPAPSGYVPTIAGVRYWDGAAPAATGTYVLSSHWQNSCPSAGDKGLQQITISLTAPDGQATETVQVLKRKIS